MSRPICPFPSEGVYYAVNNIGSNTPTPSTELSIAILNPFMNISSVIANYESIGYPNNITITIVLLNNVEDMSQININRPVNIIGYVSGSSPTPPSWNLTGDINVRSSFLISENVILNINGSINGFNSCISIYNINQISPSTRSTNIRGDNTKTFIRIDTNSTLLSSNLNMKNGYIDVYGLLDIADGRTMISSNNDYSIKIRKEGRLNVKNEEIIYTGSKILYEVYGVLRSKWTTYRGKDKFTFHNSYSPNIMHQYDILEISADTFDRVNNDRNKIRYISTVLSTNRARSELVNELRAIYSILLNDGAIVSSK
ncbi:Hypothetical protein ORPV_626 [Orpheovirus IHUMI-LCC2]|uniref:Uncharacterized protein n=1 Tax=Orpheovirus IHUMI-LCC2 TaxID=2023057 RepID=A0A2I2L4V0_9VIRU|nr:Hypothetical protein ORPV_626 [Orpheovirus IHUMI-LCC2]SNW62530.1 Hypothetical protein ORPV_626 [Orpheovirus IHUMI-LCC2]